MTPADILRLASLITGGSYVPLGLGQEYVVMGVKTIWEGFSTKNIQGAIFGRYSTVEEAEKALSGFRSRYPGSCPDIFTLAENGQEWIGLNGTRVPRG